MDGCHLSMDATREGQNHILIQIGDFNKKIYNLRLSGLPAPPLELEMRSGYFYFFEIF